MAERQDDYPHHLVRQGDVTRIGDLLDTSDIIALLDPGQPVAVLASGVLHHLPDPPPVLTTVHQRLSAGSNLAASRPDLPESLGDQLGWTIASCRLSVAPSHPRPASAAADILTTWHDNSDDLWAAQQVMSAHQSTRAAVNRRVA